MAFEVFKGQKTHADRWTRAGDLAILTKLHPDAELAEMLGRSVKAIRVRRYQLKRADPDCG
jgi:hypothetical protein